MLQCSLVLCALQVLFVRNLQRHGKGFYAINGTKHLPKKHLAQFALSIRIEGGGVARAPHRLTAPHCGLTEWGAGPDYGLNSAKIPHNISGPAHRAVRQVHAPPFY